MRTVTIMFTDVEGSTRWWETEPEHMSTALALHDQVVRAVVADFGGEIFATGGDGFACPAGICSLIWPISRFGGAIAIYLANVVWSSAARPTEPVENPAQPA